MIKNTFLNKRSAVEHFIIKVKLPGLLMVLKWHYKNTSWSQKDHVKSSFSIILISKHIKTGGMRENNFKSFEYHH